MNLIFGDFKKDLDLEMRINSKIAELDDIWDKENELLIEMVEPTLKQGIILGVKTAEISVNRSLMGGIEDASQVALDKRTNMIKRISDTTYKDIKMSLGEGLANSETIRELRKRVIAVTDLPAGRSMTIARTETGAAINEGCYVGLKNGDIQQKKWIGGQRISHAAQDGQVRDINEPFSNGQMYPGDGIGGAKENVNCRCCLGGSV